MRWIAALSCRLPDRVSRTRPAVLPDQTGIGAIPAWRGDAGLGLKRAVPAGSPTIFAAGRGAGPGLASSGGGGRRGGGSLRLAQGVVLPVGSPDSASSS